jgi:hypothetical protein
MAWFDRFVGGRQIPPPEDPFQAPIPGHEQPQLEDSSALTPGQSKYLLGSAKGWGDVVQNTKMGILDMGDVWAAADSHKLPKEHYEGPWAIEPNPYGRPPLEEGPAGPPEDLKSKLLGPEEGKPLWGLTPGDPGFKMPPKPININVQPGPMPIPGVHQGPDLKLPKIEVGDGGFKAPPKWEPPTGQDMPKKGPEIFKDHGTHGDDPDNPHGFPAGGWPMAGLPHDEQGFGVGYVPGLDFDNVWWGLKEQANSDILNQMYGIPVHPDMNKWKTKQYEKQIDSGKKIPDLTPEQIAEAKSPIDAFFGSPEMQNEKGVNFPTKWGGKFPKADYGGYEKKYPNLPDVYDIPQNEYSTGAPVPLTPDLIEARQGLIDSGLDESDIKQFDDTWGAILKMGTYMGSKSESQILEEEANALLQEDFLETGETHGIIDPAVETEKPLQSLINHFGFNESYNAEDAVEKIQKAYDNGYISATDKESLTEWAGENQEWQEEFYFSDPEIVTPKYQPQGLVPAEFSDKAKKIWDNYGLGGMTPEEANNKIDDLFSNFAIQGSEFGEIQDYILKHPKTFPFGTVPDPTGQTFSPETWDFWNANGIGGMHAKDAIQSIQSMYDNGHINDTVYSEISTWLKQKLNTGAPQGWANTGPGGHQVHRSDVPLRGADLARRIYENPANKFKDTAQGMAHPDKHRIIEAEIRDAMTPQEEQLYSSYTGASIHGGGAGKKMEVFARAITKNRRYQDFLEKHIKDLPETVIVYHGGKLSHNHQYFNGSLVEETSRDFISSYDKDYTNLHAVAVPREAIIGLGSSLESEVIIDRHLMEALKKNRAPKFERPPVDDTGFNLAPPDDDVDLGYGNDPRINQRLYRYGRER